ncbi:MAG: hypothetical protein JOZ38_02455 [Candidatus Eremiobacteraeota bacterium]|nr:hypothetical protein [Candidatus Eremiobacteraeota bacterium]
MKTRAIEIRLKIPDNAAYTAMAALERLGVAAERVERAEIWVFEVEDDADGLLVEVMRNESLFNPNKHAARELETPSPRAGEVWIEELGDDPDLRARLGGKGVRGVRSAKRYVGWRLLDRQGKPVTKDVAQNAADVLLCNPAIERALL